MSLCSLIYFGLLFLSLGEGFFTEDIDLCENVDCPVGTLCETDTGLCAPFSLPNPICPRIRCMLACEYGFERGENGCPICSCRAPLKKLCLFKQCPRGTECNPLTGECVPSCLPIMCMLHCEHGFKTRNGCPICACERPTLQKD